VKRCHGGVERVPPAYSQFLDRAFFGGKEALLAKKIYPSVLLDKTSPAKRVYLEALHEQPADDGIVVNEPVNWRRRLRYRWADVSERVER